MYLVGRGISDVTGEPANCGMLGYGKASQVSKGLHTRLRTRAFIVVDPTTNDRLLISVSDLPLMFDSVYQEVLRRLKATHGELYTEANTMLTVTHTHCGPGGYSHHRLYNSTTHGFHHKTFGAIVDGIVASVDRAHADLAPSDLRLNRGELTNASVNRSPQSFARNPESDRAVFPDGVDPQTTLLRIERDGKIVGAINWFATHGTSMKNDNCLISGDNKGYAGYHWERVVNGIDYLADSDPDFIAAFAQTNSGDMSPNLNRAPGSGPTDNHFENTRIIGRRQSDAAASLATMPGEEVTGSIDSRSTYVDIGKIDVRGEFTPDGQPHRTGSVMGGAAAIAGTDEGKGFWPFKQGRNRVTDALTRQTYYRSSKIRDAHSPKGIFLPGGVLNRIAPFVQERVPVELFRIGQLYLIGIPGEVTITAGLRMRRAVAALVGADLHNVLVAGYTNAYIHYVTTPEEYDEQRYEGGSTLFGKWEAPAFTQVAAGLATAMRDGKPVDQGAPPPDLSAVSATKPYQLKPDEPVEGRDFGAVLSAPRASYRSGDQVAVTFAGANPNHDLHRESTYLAVERADGDDWVRVADDGDWETKLHWKKAGRGQSRITITWDIPGDISSGDYRIRYFGDALDAAGTLTPFVGTTHAFSVA